jgi:hypothetical protein
MKTFLRALLFSALGLSAQALWATPVELVVNGDFETGTLAGWTRTGFTGYQAVSTDNFATPLAHTGFVFSEGADFNNGSISQMIATTSGATYTLKFDLQRLDTRGAGDGPLENFEEVTFGGVTLFSQTNVADKDWISLTFNNLAGTGGLLKLNFTGRDVYNYIQLDNISLVADPLVDPGPPVRSVPEPASIAMLLLGLGALGWARRKQA